MNKLINEFNENDFRGLDLNALVTFVALMRTGSVKLAAERVLLGPSAVSMALARLREVSGDPLFVRTRSGMSPTPRAQELYRQVEPALARIHAGLRNAPGFDPAVASGTIRLGVGDELEPFLLPGIAARLAAQAPALRLVNRACNFTTATALIDDDAIDVALCAQPENLKPWHVVRPLAKERFLCVYDPAVIAPARRLAQALYFSVPHIVRATDGSTRTRFDDLFERHGFRRTVAATAATAVAAALAVRGNRLLANLPGTAARLIAREFGLAVSELPLKIPAHQLVLLSHANRAADIRSQWFQNLVGDAFAALEA